MIFGSVFDIVTFGTYFTGFGQDRPGSGSPTWDSLQAVKALKGRTLNKGGRLPNGVNFDNTNKEVVFEWFVVTMTKYLIQRDEDGVFLLVPIPSTSALDRTGAETCLTSRMAQGIQDSMERAATVREATPTVHVDAALHFNRQLLPARQGGPREAETVYKALAFDGFNYDAEHTTVVLLDDVVSTGGHMRAAEARLRLAGHPPAFGMAAARTILTEDGRGFSRVIQQVMRFDPSPQNE